MLWFQYFLVILKEKMLSYLNVKNYVAFFKNQKKQPKQHRRYFLNNGPQQRSCPCNFSLKVYQSCGGSLDTSWEIPHTSSGVAVENKLSSADTSQHLSAGFISAELQTLVRNIYCNIILHLFNLISV